MAALIKQSLGLDAELEPGGRGEFTIWVDAVKVAEKTRTGFPAEKAVLDLVSNAVKA